MNKLSVYTILSIMLYLIFTCNHSHDNNIKTQDSKQDSMVSCCGMELNMKKKRREYVAGYSVIQKLDTIVGSRNSKYFG